MSTFRTSLFDRLGKPCESGYHGTALTPPQISALTSPVMPPERDHKPPPRNSNTCRISRVFTSLQEEYLLAISPMFLRACRDRDLATFFTLLEKSFRKTFGLAPLSPICINLKLVCYLFLS